MVVQADHLVVEVGDGQVFRGRIVDAAVAVGLGKAAVVFPLPLAAPAHQGQQAFAVAQVIDGIVFPPDVLEADAVHIHVLDVLDLHRQGFGRVEQEDVVGPAGALDEDVTAVERKLAVVVPDQPAFDLPHAEADGPGVGQDAAGGFHVNLQVVHFGAAHFPGPPHAGMAEMQLRRLFGRQGHGRDRVGGHDGRHLERTGILQVQVQECFDRMVFAVAQLDADFQVRLLAFGGLQLRDDEHVLDGKGARGVQGYRTDQAHALVERTGIPVHEAEVQVAPLRPAKPDFQLVAAVQQVLHVVAHAAEDAEGRVGRRDLRSVEEDVCAVVDAVEDQFGVLSLGRFRIELRPIDPFVVEHRLVGFGIVAGNEEVVAVIAGGIQGTGHGGRNDSGDVFRTAGPAQFPSFAQGKDRPVVQLCLLRAGAEGCRDENDPESFHNNYRSAAPMTGML